ncbi:hypothetical protein BG006_005082 [Podila minutissima]|uniref:Uncharacterized protein n=1 Tax=Podila minutissima TaxID=64525 RepID=A0A9P5SL99_9FUNG|nr:hypothetical protein BG006_005082 [Podila minutissima]
MPPLLSEQLDLLRANPGLISLYLGTVSLLALPATITSEPFMQSVKELRMSSFSEPEFVNLVNSFAKLQHIQMGEPHNRLLFGMYKLNGPGATIPTLKRLTFMGNLHTCHNFGPLLSLFHNCHRVEHIVLDLGFSYRDKLYLPRVSVIHERILAWRSGASVIDSTVTDPHEKEAPFLSPTETRVHLERLDIHVDDHESPDRCRRLQFQRGCHDLVSLTLGTVEFDDPQTVIPLINSFKHTLRYVDLKCDTTMRDGHTPFEFLGLLLGSLPELLRLKFSAEVELTKEESIAVFRGTFPQEDKGEGSSKAATAPLSNGTAGWACQRLEHLSIKGLWGSMAKDRPDEGHDAVTLRAASEKHQWVACDAFNSGKEFRDIISERMETLSALSELKLGSVFFLYSEIRL